MGRKIHNLKEGDIFGDYTVISEDIIKTSNKNKVLCRCKCGNEKEVQIYYLVDKSNNRRCNRCAKSERALLIIENRRKNGTLHKGVGDLNLTFVRSMKDSARKRGYEWNLTPEYLWNLLQKQDFKCSLSGVDIKLISDLEQGKYNFKEGTASLDRIDSNEHYVEGNVQWVHKDVNKMKNSFDEGYFIKICKYVTEKNS